MIVSPCFVWLHFPKCAGTETETILRSHFGNSPDITFDPKDPVWHDTLADRMTRDPGFELGNRKLISNFRRLPTWYESRCRSGLIQNPDLVVTDDMREKSLFQELDGRTVTPDDYLEKFILRRKPDYIIRSEFLEEDLVKVFSAFLDTAKIDSTDFKRRNRSTENTPSLSVPQARRLYELNPLWCDFEREVYGLTLCDC